MDANAKSRRVRDLARRIGFERVGITTARPIPRATDYRKWLAAGRAGSMKYMHQHAELRADPSRLFAGARSVICTAVSYARDLRDTEPPRPGTATDDTPAHPPTGRVARYARGRDYHRVVREMLEQLIDRMRAAFDTDFAARPFVDTGPLLERELAAAAGLGWIGKHTLLLHEQLGSYLFLGEIVTDLELAADAPVTDHCGSCTRCLDACPTDAFPAPYELDATRCIAYLTIEHRGNIPEDLQDRVGDWVFGCDVCQEVCPFNSKAPPGRQPDLQEDRVPARVDLLELVRLRSGNYRRLTRDSATGRATRRMWRRNAAVALGNRPDHDEKTRAALQETADDDDPPTARAARHAIARAPHRSTREAPPHREST